MNITTIYNSQALQNKTLSNKTLQFKIKISTAYINKLIWTMENKTNKFITLKSVSTNVESTLNLEVDKDFYKNGQLNYPLAMRHKQMSYIIGYNMQGFTEQEQANRLDIHQELEHLRNLSIKLYTEDKITQDDLMEYKLQVIKLKEIERRETQGRELSEPMFYIQLKVMISP